MTDIADPPRPPRIPKSPAPQVVASPTIRGLAAALDAAPDPAAALGAFWSRAQRATTPLVEERPGDPGRRIVTFLWRGEATEVLAMVNKLTDPSVWPESTLERLPGTDVWHRSYRLPADWRATYHLAPLDGAALAPDAARGPARRWSGAAARATTDPLNPRTFPGARGAPPLSVVELPDAPPRDAAAPAAGVARGRVSRHQPSCADRPVWIYEPAAAGDEPHALAVLLDGEQWLTRMGVPVILDNLIASGRLAPTVAVLPDAGDTAARWRELACSADYMDALAGDLLEWVGERWPVTGDPARTTIAGQSLGGLSALFAALHAPGRFGRVLAQSASLWWPTDDLAGRGRGALLELAATSATLPDHVRLEVGSEEWVLLDWHRRLREILVARGATVSYREYSGGHDALCWQEGMISGLPVAAGSPARPGPR